MKIKKKNGGGGVGSGGGSGWGSGWMGTENLSFCENSKKKFGGGGGGRGRGGVGLRGQGGCERRSKVFVKIKKKNQIFCGGGWVEVGVGGPIRGWGGGGG